jgi:hypothetical protein
MHHQQGIVNGIWSDMAIATTFMRYGHGHSGIIGLTMKPEALKTWAMGIHGINTLMADLNSVKEDQLPSQTHHKE